jgi:hypothetical protein
VIICGLRNGYNLEEGIGVMYKSKAIIVRVSHYWDGPLEGEALYRGKRYWFEYAYRNDETYRLYLKDKRFWKHQDQIKKIFIKYVGDHWEYDNGERRKNPYKKRILPGNRFYEWYKYFKRIEPKQFRKKKGILCRM